MIEIKVFFFLLKLKIIILMCFFVVCFNDYLLVLSEIYREYGLYLSRNLVKYVFRFNNYI